MKRVFEWLKGSVFGRLFLHKKFAYYTWTSIFVSILNVFLLWLMIDIIGIPTVISSIAVVISTFLIRYILFDFFEVM